MNRLFWIVSILLFLGMIAATGVDLTVSHSFYRVSSGWYLADRVPWRWLYLYGQYPAIVLAVGALVVLLASWWRLSWHRYRRRCLFLVLVVALGPGLIINTVLKPGWGRPRPRQIQAFNGEKTYRGWWQPAGLGAGKSFPSGHASMGFVMLAGIILIPRQRVGFRVVGVMSALGYSGVMSAARIVQGAHFLSDVLGAGVVVNLVLWGAYWGLKIEPRDDTESTLIRPD